MNCLLAIETATEACSVALWRDGEVSEIHEVIPQQHSQRLFGMLRELLRGGLREQGVQGIAYGCGPGSFTGLRLAASAVQGLAYACNLQAIPVSTLACQAQTAVRLGIASPADRIASLIDARVNEVYCALYGVEDGRVTGLSAPRACAPGEVDFGGAPAATVAVGSGARFLDGMPAAVRAGLRHSDAGVLPHARDLVPLALAAVAAGTLQEPTEVSPVYVRDEIHWKKIDEQGKRT